MCALKTLDQNESLTLGRHVGGLPFHSLIHAYCLHITTDVTKWKMLDSMMIHCGDEMLNRTMIQVGIY